MTTFYYRPSGSSSTVGALTDLTDVNIASVADAQMLVYDASVSLWLNRTISGDITINKAGVTTLTTTFNLQTAYGVSSDPQIVLDSTNGGLSLTDASTPIGATLFEVQNNARTLNFFKVDASNVYIGVYKFPLTDGTADQVLKTDGLGVLTWQDSGGGVGDTIVSPTTNSACQDNEYNPSMTGTANTFIGVDAGDQMTTGGNNTFVGHEAGSHGILIGSDNTCIGAQAGYGLGGGSVKNVAIGRKSMLVWGGNYNTTVGTDTQASTPYVFHRCVAIGNAALVSGSYGICIGDNAGVGLDSVSIGYNAGRSTTRSVESVLIGSECGKGLNNDGCVYLGNEVGKTNLDTANTLAIHNSDSANPLIHGNFSTGNLKINGDLQVPTKTPASSSDTGIAGTITWDTSYVYVCTATDTWKRVAIATW